MRMQKKFKNFLAMLMAVVTVIGVVSPGHMVSAANMETENYAVEETKEQLKLYDKSERTDLEVKEVASAEDIIIAQGYGFCVEEDMDGISYDESATKVSYYPEKSHFDANKTGDYDNYDLFVCMDSANVRNATRILNGDKQNKVKKLLSFED